MRRFFSVVAVIGITAALSGCGGRDAHAPLICNVSLNSPEGGLIRALRVDNTEKLSVPSRQLAWTPPKSSGEVDLRIGYEGNTLEHLPPPAGGSIRFTVPEGVATDGLQVAVSTADGEIARFNGTEMEVAMDSSMKGPAGAVRLAPEAATSKGIFAAVEAGKRIKVVILNADKVIDASEFETSATKGRDALIARVREVIARSDRHYCEPLPQ